MSGLVGATLFSGIGAPEAAMPHWRWPWHAEIERFPSAVMNARHPHSVNLGDVSKDGFADVARAVASPDVLVFGSPCQSFSVAGKRLGLDDPRGNLALVALKVVGALRPRWFVFENVPGLLSLDDGRAFGTFLRLVEQCGYGWSYRTLDAQFFGVPQRRRRVFVVGHLGDWRRAAAVLFEPGSLRWDTPPSRETGEEIASTVEASLGRRCGQPNDHDPAGWLIADPITSSFHKHHGASAGKDSIPRNHVIAKALNAKGGGPAVAFTLHGADKTRSTATQTELAGSIRARPVGGIENSSTTCVIHASAVRRLTPEECEALQGFSRRYTAVIYRGKPAADGPRYKALGNSMAVPVMRWILSRIELCAALSPDRSAAG